MKMEQTECSETLAYKIQTPGNYPEENILHTEHGVKFEIEKTYLFVNHALDLSSNCYMTVEIRNPYPQNTFDLKWQ